MHRIMKEIVVLTSTRADYGLLSGMIKKMMCDKDIKVRVAVTGMHLSPEFGLTYQEIEKDGINIDKKIEILLGADTSVSMSKTMGLAMISFADYFAEICPDALLVLGDRYETLAVCCAALNAKIPIIHLHGGETTEGAVDEAIRHSITKMSYLHFTSTEAYRQRVIQLGENPERVYNVGALGVENVLNQPLLPKEKLGEELGVKLDNPYAVVTYHPVTLNKHNIDGIIRQFLNALDQNPDMYYIITKANADAGGRKINQMLEEYAMRRKNVKVYDSLGMLRYLSAVKYSEMVIGNSSSGILEVPSLGIPTVNIGDRQKGRIRAGFVIDCAEDTESITNAIKKAKTPEFKEMCKHVQNPYEGRNTSETIVKLIKENIFEKKVQIKKKFYDIEM